MDGMIDINEWDVRYTEFNLIQTLRFPESLLNLYIIMQVLHQLSYLAVSLVSLVINLVWSSQSIIEHFLKYKSHDTT